MKPIYRIDSEFYNLTIPLPSEEYMELEKSILLNGCSDPIRTWDGIIIDGHKRYKICSAAKMDFPVENMYFPSREDAIIWACNERIPHVIPGSSAFKYLIGKQYICEKDIYHRSDHTRDVQKDIIGVVKSGEKFRVSLLLASKYKINHTTVEKYGTLSAKMDLLASKSPKSFQALLAGRIHLSQKTIEEITQWENKKIGYYVRGMIMEKEKKRQDKFIRNEKMQHENSQRKQNTEVNEIPLSVGIKEMPAFDPDMAIRGLTLTIPTWIGSIERAISKTKVELVSPQARDQLIQSLLRLDEQIMLAMEAVEK